jgi:hypothetical protein
MSLLTASFSSAFCMLLVLFTIASTAYDYATSDGAAAAQQSEFLCLKHFINKQQFTFPF